MRIVRPHAQAWTAIPVAGAGRDFRVVSSARHATNYMFTFFLTWVREGRHHPFIRMPRTCRKVRSQNQPPRQEAGEKGGRRMT